MNAKCVVCTRPVNGANLCAHCLGTVERALGDVPALEDELNITSTRQSVTGSRNGSRSTTKPLPFNWSADHDLDDLRGTLVGWVRIIGPDVEKIGGPTCQGWCSHMSCNAFGQEVWPQDTLTSMSGWLLKHLNEIAQSDHADEIHDEIGYTVQQSYRAIDRRADRWYAGQCRSEHATDEDTDEDNACCAVHLYADPSAEMFNCPNCRTTFNSNHRRTELLLLADDILESATVIARALSTLEHHVTPERIRQWAHRGRIIAHSVDLNGHPLYRVGDVIDRLQEDMASAERRASRRAG